ncbi:hypothetical protein [Bradyrhizobium sp. SZCCHNS2015]|uniref:hypothetical protein n=1 Tax=Bradyrhizobium sp. SZCCHNS2015 TaxID=3057305 RepID=UPI0028EFACEA|nr:hypothetical protein [Bradyrhizobium sp. SZCCHNS2015]
MKSVIEPSKFAKDLLEVCLGQRWLQVPQMAHGCRLAALRQVGSYLGYIDHSANPFRNDPAEKAVRVAPCRLSEVVQKRFTRHESFSL